MRSTENKNVMIFGATSAIAQSTAQLLAEQHNSMVLLGRNEQKLEIIAKDLEVRGATIKDMIIADLAKPETHTDIMQRGLSALNNKLDIALYAQGILGNQQKAEADFNHALDIINTNFTGMVSLLTQMANHMEQQKHGHIIAISSVAGDRGRQSNYVYGSSKAALSIFMDGLRNRLFKSGIQVLTVKPGFVDTPMTADIDKGPLFVKPEVIARGIIKAIEKNRNTVYLPWFWWAIMSIIKCIPEEMFKRMKL